MLFFSVQLTVAVGSIQIAINVKIQRKVAHELTSAQAIRLTPEKWDHQLASEIKAT